MLRPDFTVADLGELSTLHVSGVAEGANVWVESEGDYWTLEKNSGAPIGPNVIAPLAGSPASGATNARWIREAGSGGGVSGDPNSILFENPSGSAAITDPNLTAGRVDAFGRPAVIDRRFSAIVMRGSIYRNGAWEADGDPSPSVKGEGFVTIGANALGLGPDPTEGAYFFATPASFGVAQIINGVNGNNLFYACGFEDGSPDAPFGIGDAFVMNDNFAVQQFHIDRATGTVMLGSPDSTHGGTGQFFMNQSGPLGGSTAPVQWSQVTKSNALRLAQYGAIAATPNVSFFRSRGATIGALASCAVGDSMMNFTASGVTADNASVPLAAIFDAVIPVGGLFPQSISPNFRWQLARDLINSRRVVWTMVGLSGDFVMAAPPTLPSAPTQGARILIHEGTVSTPNAMQGLAVTDVAGTAVVANTLITANTRIALTWQDGGAAPVGVSYVASRIPGTSFTIQGSGGGADAGVNVFWQLWEPAP